MSSFVSVLDEILRDNVAVVDNKYLIFYLSNGQSACFGTIDCLSAGDNYSESMSFSSDASELSFDQNSQSA
ncbi:lef-10 [Hyphantria cunea granulovirus]|uniref:Lef-10 n=1 Tax=Hyphantria cunea granulovirus TaxID=307448 RepID=A0AAF1D2C0_9BBAC|nr:lef-10 [Hyphantria cunea granulovirus]QBQ01678.1 lef-10 [Hyphantria cunea granulovirus]